MKRKPIPIGGFLKKFLNVTSLPALPKSLLLVNMPPIAGDADVGALPWLDIRPLKPHFGVAVWNANIHDWLASSSSKKTAVLAHVRSLVYKHGLVVFKAQTSMTPADDVTIARFFSHDPSEDHANSSYTGGAAPQHKLPNQPEVALVGAYEVTDYHGFTGTSQGTYGASRCQNKLNAVAWHNDGFADTYPPPELTLMRCIKTPAAGGETLFACSRRCASRLIEQREHFDPPPESVTVHYRLFKGATRRTSGLALKAAPDDGATRDDGWQNTSAASGTAHPLLVREPNSGDVTMVGTYHVAGVTAPSCEPLNFDASNEYVERAWKLGIYEDEDSVLTYEWGVGDCALWSNKLVTHSATPASYAGSEQRLHHRVRLRANPCDVPRAAFGEGAVAASSPAPSA